MQHALSYTRFSTGTQSRGSSAERQHLMVDRWLSEHPDVQFHPDLSPADLGVSGWSGKTLEAGLGELLEATRSGAIGEGWAILIESYDRLGRMEPLDMLAILTEIVNAGVVLVTLEDGLEYSRTSLAQNASLLFIVVGKVQQAHQYSETLSRRISASYDRRRREAAQGIRPRRRTPWWMTNEGELKEPEATAARRMFDGVLAGLGERRLLRQLQTDLGPDCPLSEPTSVKRSLQNRMAIGEWEGNVVYPQLVDTDTFLRVQQTIESRVLQNTAQARSWRLTGICKCGCCGANLQIKRNKGRQHQAYCGTRSRRGPEACPNGRSLPDLVAGWIVAAAEPHYLEQAEAQHTDSGTLVQLESTVTELEEQVAAAVDALLTVRSAALKARLSAIEAELAEAKAAYARALQTAPAPMLGSVDTLLAGEYDELEHNRTLQRLGVELVWFPDGSITCGDQTYQYEGWTAKTGYKLLDATGQRVDLQHHV